MKLEEEQVIIMEEDVDIEEVKKPFRHNDQSDRFFRGKTRLNIFKYFSSYFCLCCCFSVPEQSRQPQSLKITGEIEKPEAWGSASPGTRLPLRPGKVMVPGGTFRIRLHLGKNGQIDGDITPTGGQPTKIQIGERPTAQTPLPSLDSILHLPPAPSPSSSPPSPDPAPLLAVQPEPPPALRPPLTVSATLSSLLKKPFDFAEIFKIPFTLTPV